MTPAEQRASEPPGDDEVEAFFEALAGRGLGNAVASDAGNAGVLRAALLREQAATSAESLPNASVTAAQLERNQATLARLTAEGVFVVPPATAPATAPAAKRSGTSLAALLSPLRDLLFVPWPWPRLAALSGGMAVVALLLVVKPWATDPGADDVLRGAQVPAVAVDAPETFAQELRAQLQALGADAMLVQINADEWVVTANVSPSTALAPVVALLKARGFGAVANPPFELRVQRSKAQR